MMKPLRIGLALFCVALSPRISWADSNSTNDGSRLSIFAGAGSGVVVSSRPAIPFRFNAGVEYFFQNYRRLSIGYVFAAPVTSEQINVRGVSTSLFRTIHYFPRLRFFLFNPDFTSGGLSLNLAPGVAFQRCGGRGMMNYGTSMSSGTYLSPAVQSSLEYLFKLEDRLQLGLEGSAEYIAPTHGSVAIPRTVILSAMVNLHWGHFNP